MTPKSTVLLVALVLLTCPKFLSGQASATQGCQLKLARLQYDGGGDWYANPSSLPNLVSFVRSHTDIALCDTVVTISLEAPDLFAYPFIYMTGHGTVAFSEEQRLRLRRYLSGGGLLWADDNYGMDESLRQQLQLLFPDNPLRAVAVNHPLFYRYKKFTSVPKIHEHDGEAAQGLGIFFENRLVVFYTYSADIGDGMEDPHVHSTPEQKHRRALEFATAILMAFVHP